MRFLDNYMHIKVHFHYYLYCFNRLHAYIWTFVGSHGRGCEETQQQWACMHSNGIQTGVTVQRLTCARSSQWSAEVSTAGERDSPSMTPSVACPDRRGWSSILMPSSMMHVSDCSPAERRSCSDTRPVAISIRIRSDLTRKSRGTQKLSGGSARSRLGTCWKRLSSVWHTAPQLGGGTLERELK